jgi:hypothetical protein
MQPIPSPTAAQKPQKLRWFQWRLRSLFVLTLLVAIGMSWLTVTIQCQRKQKAAAEIITNGGGTVSSRPTWLGKLLRDDSLIAVTVVNLSGVEFVGGKPPTTDDVMPYLEGLDQLQELLLDETQVTDAGLAHLHGLSQLQTLDLAFTHVTDAGLVHLQELSQLRSLNLAVTPVSDAGLAHLHGLSQLRSLVLHGTKITDAGLVHLEGLSQLQSLRITRTQVTDQGVKKLQQILPNCTIYWSYKKTK